MAQSKPLPKTDGSKQRLRLWIGLLKGTKRVENAVRDRLRREFDTTLPRFDVMAMLQKSGLGLKMSELSSELMVSNGNVTGIIDRLVSDGLVVRVSIKGDRRATLVRLTPKGETEFGQMASAHEGWIAEFLGDLSELEMDRMAAALTKVKDSVHD